MELVDGALVGRCIGAILQGTGSPEQKNRGIARFFNGHLKSRNGNVLGELYCISQKYKFGNEPLVEAALKKYESETQEVRDLLALRNRNFGLNEIAQYLAEFRGYRQFGDILVQFRLAGVLADEWMTWSVLRDPKGALEPLRHAGYSAKEIIFAYERLLQEEFGGSRMMNAPDVVEALLRAGFDGKKIAVGLKQAGYTASETGLGILGARVIINGGREALRFAGELDWAEAYELVHKITNNEMIAFAADMVAAGYLGNEAFDDMNNTFFKLKDDCPLEANLLVKIRDRLSEREGLLGALYLKA